MEPNITDNLLPQPAPTKIDFEPIDAAPKIDFTPVPKIPDMSGVQKIATDNMAAQPQMTPSPDGKMSFPIDAAVGMPATNILSGNGKDVQMSYPMRKELIKSYVAGDTSTPDSFMQMTLHSTVPIVAAAINRAMHPIDTLENYGKQVIESGTQMVKGGAGLLAYPFVSEVNKEELRKGYELTDYKNPDAPTAVEKTNRALELWQGTVGRAMGGLYAPAASVISPLLSPVIEESANEAKALGVENEWAKLVPKFLGVGMDVLGMAGIAHIAGELRGVAASRVEAQRTKNGPWDTVPGNEHIKQIVGDGLGKPAEAVTSPEVDAVIAEGSKNMAPAAADFNAAAAYMGTTPSTLQVIFVETRKRPENIIADAKSNPQIAEDVAIGKVPDAYSALVADTAAVPVEQHSGMSVRVSDTKQGFEVVDNNGDYVSSGFDSAAEAQKYIDDLNAPPLDYPPEWDLNTISEPKTAAKAILESPKISEDVKLKVRALGDNPTMEDLQRVTTEESAKPATEKTAAGEQSVIPGAEKISDKALAERGMEGGKQTTAPQKPANEGLFDVGARSQSDLFQKKPNIIPPSEIGKPTSLRTFLSNNGAKFNESNELVSIKKNGERVSGEAALEHANEIAKEHGYLPEDSPNAPSATFRELQNLLTEKNGGREAFRSQDADRISKAEENRIARELADPAYIEYQAHNVGLDTERVKGETDKQFIARLIKGLDNFYKNQEGSGSYLRKVIGDVIIAAEKFAGKIAGELGTRIGEAYIRVFQPELVGPKAKRADAFMAKYKTAKQAAENAFFKLYNDRVLAFNKLSKSQSLQWMFNHEEGAWSKEDASDHIRHRALFKAAFDTEKAAGVSDAAFKNNYFPHFWKNPVKAEAYFRSSAFIKKYGNDAFTKHSTFRLIKDGMEYGLELADYNPEHILWRRLSAGQDLMYQMDMLHSMERDSIAVPTTAFSIDKRLAKAQETLAKAKEKYSIANAKINDPKQTRWHFANDNISKYMKGVQARIDTLTKEIEELGKEKEKYKNIPKDMKDNSFRIIGPDSRAWSIHNQVAPLWKNAMDSKGLWENRGMVGDAYRGYMKGKAIWVSNKLAISLFHPAHELVIHLANSHATAIDHLIKGGKFSDINFNDLGIKFAFDKDGLNLFASNKDATFGIGRDHPAVTAWNTVPEMRTPEQHAMVNRMIEGGFKPSLSERDLIRFKENWDKAINGIGVNNLRLVGSAVQLLGKFSAPVFEHWIPALKSEAYFRQTDLALKRDPSLLNDAGRRGEMLREIAQNIDRNYGELNRDTLFWDKTVKDTFDALTLSVGWKLAMLQNFRGLAAGAKISYDFLKTGKFSKQQITQQILQAYLYTAYGLILGGAATYSATGAVHGLVDFMYPNTGDKNPDGSEIRLGQPAFFREMTMWKRDIDQMGLMKGTGSFAYGQTLIPGIHELLTVGGGVASDLLMIKRGPIGEDALGRAVISDPLDAHEWAHAGVATISPIAFSSYEKADSTGSTKATIGALLGFPLAARDVNYTSLQRKILYTYYELNPSKESVYTAYLKTSLKSAIASNNVKKIDQIEGLMKGQNMTESDIQFAKKIFTKPFVDHAWEKLPRRKQLELLRSVSDEEKANYKVNAY